MDLSHFTNTEFHVTQGQAADGRIQSNDTVELTAIGAVYTLKVNGDSVSDDLLWDSNRGCLKGTGSEAGFVIQISFYEQESPELRVLYGVIIDTDPDSVGAWAADDQ